MVCERIPRNRGIRLVQERVSLGDALAAGVLDIGERGFLVRGCSYKLLLNWDYYTIYDENGSHLAAMFERSGLKVPRQTFESARNQDALIGISPQGAPAEARSSKACPSNQKACDELSGKMECAEASIEE